MLKERSTQDVTHNVCDMHVIYSVLRVIISWNIIIDKNHKPPNCTCKPMCQQSDDSFSCLNIPHSLLIVNTIGTNLRYPPWRSFCRRCSFAFARENRDAGAASQMTRWWIRGGCAEWIIGEAYGERRGKCGHWAVLGKKFFFEFVPIQFRIDFAR